MLYRRRPPISFQYRLYSRTRHSTPGPSPYLLTCPSSVSGNATDRHSWTRWVITMRSHDASADEHVIGTVCLVNAAVLRRSEHGRFSFSWWDRVVVFRRRRHALSLRPAIPFCLSSFVLLFRHSGSPHGKSHIITFPPI